MDAHRALSGGGTAGASRYGFRIDPLELPGDRTAGVLLRVDVHVRFAGVEFPEQIVDRLRLGFLHAPFRDDLVGDRSHVEEAAEQALLEPFVLRLEVVQPDDDRSEDFVLVNVRHGRVLEVHYVEDEFQRFVALLNGRYAVGIRVDVRLWR